MTADGEEPVIPGAGRWVLYTPYGSHMPWQNGKWRSLVFPWLLKRFALEDRANHSEVAGSPTWVGKAPQGSTEKQRNRFLAQLVGLGRKGRFVLPENWDLVLREASGRTWEIYSEAIVWADQAMTIILAGQVVTTEGSPGFSSGNVQDAIKEDFIRFDAESFSTCLFEQSLFPLGLINGWKTKDIPWPIWNTERPVDREQLARTLEQLGRAVTECDKSLAKDNLRINLAQILRDQKVPLLVVPQDKAAPTVTIPLAPTDVAKTITVNEYRRTLGYKDLPGDKGNQFVAEQAPSKSEELKAPTPKEPAKEQA
jgi:phage gp29-like protein